MTRSVPPRSTEPLAVLIIGDGAAGTAAGFEAASRGARVTVVSASAGATALSSGAVDDIPWTDLVRAERTLRERPRARPLGPDDATEARVAAFIEALDLWCFPAPGEPLALLATMAGRVRPARGNDCALLDLAYLGAGSVAVPVVRRPGWDAHSLAACWNAEPILKDSGITFVPFEASLLRYDGEDRISDVDLAERHDDPARIQWLAARLKDALARTTIRPQAVILGPWLGTYGPRSAALTQALGIPAGEAIGGPGGPAGIRFVRARDRLLEQIGAQVVSGRVVEMWLDDDDDGRPSVAISGEDERRIFDRVVLACGGLVGGGIVYDPPDVHAGGDMPDRSTAVFRLSMAVHAHDVEDKPWFAAFGSRIGVVGSMFGPNLDTTAWPTPGRPGVLEAVGVACDSGGLAGPSLALAGDIVADQPRTLLFAVRSGLRAGARAAAR